MGKLHHIPNTVKLFALQSVLTLKIDPLIAFFLALRKVKYAAVSGVSGVGGETINNPFRGSIEAKSHILLEGYQSNPLREASQASSAVLDG